MSIIDFLKVLFAFVLFIVIIYYAIKGGEQMA